MQDISQTYSLLAEQVQSLAEGEPLWLPLFANVSTAISEALDDLNWVGFYIVCDAETLVLGPYVGRIACTSIKRGRGVCGTAWQNDAVIVVPDVHAFDGHIACDSASRSEIVLPIRRDGQVVAVLDIDSPLANRFSTADEQGLTHIADILSRLTKWQSLGSHQN